jgi:ribosome-associated protein
VRFLSSFAALRWTLKFGAIALPDTLHLNRKPMNANEEEAPLSKTRRKQQMEELQALGEDLVEMSTERIKTIGLPEELRSAVSDARRMTRHDEARRRQMQYIGKIMRNVDVEPIRAALALVRGESASETARLHRLERLRTDLLADETVLQVIATDYPTVDLQHLRSLRRAALKEHGQNKAPRSYRAIYQLLKDLEQEKRLGIEHSENDE